MLNAEFLFHVSFAVASFFPFVSASIYPTQPIQATVWSADQPMLINWVEDGTYPTLNLMAPLNVMLYCNTDTFLMQLASAVDPQSKSVQVTVPKSVLKDGSKYTVRLITDKPIDTVIYTADFAIMPANTSTSASASTNTNTNTNTASGSGAVGATHTSGTHTSESGTGTQTKTGSMTSSTGTASVAISRTAIPSGVLPPPGLYPGGQAPVQGQKKNAGRRTVDIEKFKFRLVFVIWPVLMGITMAL